MRLISRLFCSLVSFSILVIVLLTGSAAIAKSPEVPVKISFQNAASAYDPGSPAYIDIWVDAQLGNDVTNSGGVSSPFRTLTRAWESVPVTNPLNHAVRINLQPGTYTENMIPNYWENRYGTYTNPILIRGAGSVNSQVILQNTVNMYNVHFVYFDNLEIALNGDVFHCEACDHILLRNLILNGGAQVAQETIKINQSQYIFIENNDISGAWDNAIDFVSVQFAQIYGNKIHNAGDWCAYTKGGSAYIRVERNQIYDCGTGGFTAGQGTGFQFMASPWIKYEAYDIKVVNNIIHDTDGAGLGVNGGYDILMAYNTLYRVGSRSHVFEAVFGSRSCDGVPGDSGRERCNQYLNAGGWGTTVVDNGNNEIHIPNKNVYIYNNIILNPTGYKSEWQHFQISEPAQNPTPSHVPNPTLADDNLQIRGNIIWNGDVSMPLGIEDSLACQNSNTACNAAQLISENTINSTQPQVADPSSGNYHPVGDWMGSVTSLAIPDFPAWGLNNMPAGTISNLIAADFDSINRSAGNPPGAFITNIPVVASSLRSGANPTNSSIVNFEVTFSTPVTGVDRSDFSLNTSGISGMSILDVSGTGTKRIVRVLTGTGTGSLKLDLIDDDSILDSESISLGGAGAGNGNFNNGQSFTLMRTLNIASAAKLDGWVLEKSEFSETGGSKNNSGYLLVGDNSKNSQYSSLLSFDTSSLPDTAVVTSAVIRLKLKSVTGTNPLTTHGLLVVDIFTGNIGSLPVLELTDFQSPATLLAGGVYSSQSAGWYQIDLTPAALSLVNSSGNSQFRLKFSVDDNNDRGADYLNFYSGNHASNSRPVFQVSYTMP